MSSRKGAGGRGGAGADADAGAGKKDNKTSAIVTQGVAKLRAAVKRLASCQCFEKCTACKLVYPAMIVCDASVISNPLDVICPTCLESNEEVRLLLDAAAKSPERLCPFCCENKLLPEPVMFMPPNEPLRTAQELLSQGNMYDVRTTLHYDATTSHPHADGDAITVFSPPKPGMKVSDTYNSFKSVHGPIGFSWWKGEKALLRRFNNEDAVKLITSRTAHVRKMPLTELKSLIAGLYAQKLQADARERALGHNPEDFPHFYLERIKMEFGVQSLQQEQLYAIGATVRATWKTDVRVNVFARMTGYVARNRYSALTSDLLMEFIAMTTAGNAAPFTGYMVPYLFLSECLKAIDTMFVSNAIWNLHHVKTDREYKHLTPPWSNAARRQLLGKVNGMAVTIRDIVDHTRPHVHLSLKAGESTPIVQVDEFLQCVLDAWEHQFLRLRDEKRVFRQYWIKKHTLIFLSAKKFRILSPFRGTASTSVPPHFTPGEITRMWDVVHTMGYDFPNRPLPDLDDPKWKEIDFDYLAANVRWVVPRTPWQIRQLWRVEWAAWLKREHSRMDWYGWPWDADWEWGGIDLDVSSPYVALDSDLSLTGLLGERVKTTWDKLPVDSHPALNATSAFNRSYKTLLETAEAWEEESEEEEEEEGEEGSEEESEEDAESGADGTAAGGGGGGGSGDDPLMKGAVVLPEGTAAGLPLRNRAAPLQRHRMEAMAINVESVDSLAAARPTLQPTSPGLTETLGSARSLRRSLSATGMTTIRDLRSVASPSFRTLSPVSAAARQTAWGSPLKFGSPVGVVDDSPDTMTSTGTHPVPGMPRPWRDRTAMSSLRPGSCYDLRRRLANTVDALPLPTPSPLHRGGGGGGGRGGGGAASASSPVKALRLSGSGRSAPMLAAIATSPMSSARGGAGGPQFQDLPLEPLKPGATRHPSQDSVMFNMFTEPAPDRTSLKAEYDVSVLSGANPGRMRSHSPSLAALARERSHRIRPHDPPDTIDLLCSPLNPRAVSPSPPTTGGAAAGAGSGGASASASAMASSPSPSPSPSPDPASSPASRPASSTKSRPATGHSQHAAISASNFDNAFGSGSTGRALCLTSYGIGQAARDLGRELVEVETRRVALAQATSDRSVAASKSLSATTQNREQAEFKAAQERQAAKIAARELEVAEHKLSVEKWKLRQRYLRKKGLLKDDGEGDTPPALPDTPSDTESEASLHPEVDEGLGFFQVTDPADTVARLEPLTHVVLRDNDIDDKGGRDLIDALAKIPTVQLLDLSCNKIGWQGAKWMSSIIQWSALRLTDLILEDNRLGNRGVSALVDGLIKSRCLASLRSIDLARNDVSSTTDCVRLLKGCTALTKLDLSWNAINANAAIELALGLPVSSSLRDLRLQFNVSIGDEAGGAILRACTASDTPIKRRPGKPKAKRRKRGAAPRRQQTRGGPPPVKLPRPPPSVASLAAKAFPVGSKGGGCRVRSLDMSFTGLAIESGFAAVTCLRSWIKPMVTVTDAQLSAFVESEAVFAGRAFLDQAITAPADVPEGFGSITGLQRLLLVGCPLQKQHIDELLAIASSAAADVRKQLNAAFVGLNKLWLDDVRVRQAEVAGKMKEWEAACAVVQQEYDTQKAKIDKATARRVAMYSELYEGEELEAALEEQRKLSGEQGKQLTLELPARDFEADDPMLDEHNVQAYLMEQELERAAVVAVVPEVIVVTEEEGAMARGQARDHWGGAEEVYAAYRKRHGMT